MRRTAAAREQIRTEERGRLESTEVEGERRRRRGRDTKEEKRQEWKHSEYEYSVVKEERK